MYVFPEVLVLEDENSQQLSEREKKVVNNHIHLNICKIYPKAMLNKYYSISYIPVAVRVSVPLPSFCLTVDV